MVLPPVRDAFRAIAAADVPEAEGLDEAGWAELERLVEKALETRPERVRRHHEPEPRRTPIPTHD